MIRRSRRLNKLSSPLVVLIEELAFAEAFELVAESVVELEEVDGDSVLSLAAGAPETSAAVEVTKERPAASLSERKSDRPKSPCSRRDQSRPVHLNVLTDGHQRHDL